MLDTPRRLVIAAVYAHPDDGEFFAGGSLAKWAAAGHRVVAICASDGALGTKRLDSSPNDLGAIRARELAAALAVLGGELPIMLGFPDGFLRDHAAALRERLIYQFRSLRPDRVITFDPFKRYEIHPDHATVGRMASEAAVFSCFPLLHPEHLAQGIAPAQPEEVWYMGPLDHKPNRFIDIAATLEKKVEATLCHGTQIELLANWFVEGADPAQLTDEHRARLRDGTRGFLEMMGRGLGFASGSKIEIAEAFYALKTGPGHFDNQRQMMMEMMGAPPEDAEMG
jgi:LmbE family N-acetylglucosaminyl deacetylase